MPERRTGRGPTAEATRESEDFYRSLLQDLSRMAEPAIVAHLKRQVSALHEALGYRKGDVYDVLKRTYLTANPEVFERYGLHPAISDVLLEDNPEGSIFVIPSEDGAALTVSGINQADIFLNPHLTYPLLHLHLRHKNEHRRQLSSYLGHEGALKAIGSPVLDEADAYLNKIWRLHAPEGITEEYKNAQALIWSVEHLAHEQGLLKTPLHPYYTRDILTVGR